MESGGIGIQLRKTQNRNPETMAFSVSSLDVPISTESEKSMRELDEFFS